MSKVTKVLAAALFIAAIAQAAPGEAVLAGAVLDPSGLGIPGVTLTLIESATGVSRTAVSGGTGLYRLTDLPKGAYQLRARYPGFEPYSEAVTLDENGVPRLNVTLQLSDESVTVAMAAQSPALSASV